MPPAGQHNLGEWATDIERQRRRRADSLDLTEIARLGQQAVHVRKDCVGVLHRRVARRGEGGVFFTGLDWGRRHPRYCPVTHLVDAFA